MRQRSLFGVLLLALVVLGWQGTSAAQGAKPAAAKRATGTVTSVAATSLAITGAGGKAMTFAVDAKTMVTGKGLGTKASTTGGKLAITDAVKAGDKVAVTYHETGGTMQLASVRVTASAAK